MCTAGAGQVICYCLPRFELELARSTLANFAFSKTRTSRNVRNGTGRTHRNREIVHKQLAGFSDLNEGLIIRERIKRSCIFYDTKVILNTELWCSNISMIYRVARRPYTTKNMVQLVYYSPVLIQSKTAENRFTDNSTGSHLMCPLIYYAEIITLDTFVTSSISSWEEQADWDRTSRNLVTFAIKQKKICTNSYLRRLSTFHRSRDINEKDKSS